MDENKKTLLQKKVLQAIDELKIDRAEALQFIRTMQLEGGSKSSVSSTGKIVDFTIVITGALGAFRYSNELTLPQEGEGTIWGVEVNGIFVSCLEKSACWGIINHSFLNDGQKNCTKVYDCWDFAKCNRSRIDGRLFNEAELWKVYENFEAINAALREVQKIYPATKLLEKRMYWTSETTEDGLVKAIDFASGETSQRPKCSILNYRCTFG